MKKRYLYLIIILLFNGLTFAQDSLEVKKLYNKIESLEYKIDSISNNTNYLKHSGEISIKSGNEQKLWEFLFPSIIALTVGLFALFGTIYTGKKQRKLSENQLSEQLKQAKNTVEEQIKSSKEILELQIKSADKNAELEFRQNVLSNNRQNWINELRALICDITALINVSALKKTLSYEELRNLKSLITKVELMLNPKKDSEFIKALNKLNNALLKVVTEEIEYSEIGTYETKVLDFTKKTLKTEWERVKKGE
ncbi:hypothetical protein FUA26_05400 [Seonamhaeicola algicola]|uniref:Uncharacterized protein n=3 Tax=Flavobacteriaceae TaxID=49546 RepID=A0A5C7AUP0_9FLAO|nr:hypothetical protein FUA26_05400 [Seonamhaeicola algicola]TYA97189.1 hypothetical protein FUA24_00255 [Seonamhaeicola marinus]